MTDNQVKQANRAAFLKNLFSGGAAATTRAAARPAAAAAHSAFNYLNPGAPRLSTEELKKRLTSRAIGSAKDEFTGMLPWSRK